MQSVDVCVLDDNPVFSGVEEKWVAERIIAVYPQTLTVMSDNRFVLSCICREMFHPQTRSCWDDDLHVSVEEEIICWAQELLLLIALSSGRPPLKREERMSLAGFVYFPIQVHTVRYHWMLSAPSSRVYYVKINNYLTALSLATQYSPT